MEITLQELAASLGGQLASGVDGSVLLHGAAALGEAIPGEVSFYGNAKYFAALKQTQASAVLVTEAEAAAVPTVAICVENPSLAFARVVERFLPPPIVPPPGVHPTAVIGSGVYLGEGCSIGAYAVLEDGAKIGEGSVVGPHCVIGHSAVLGSGCWLHARVTVSTRCRLGERVIVQSGAVIGSDGFGYEFSEGRHVKIPQVGIVQIDDDVEIGANVTIDRARFGRTWIQEGSKIDNLVQIGHNVVIGKHCLVVAQVGISGSSRLGNLVTLAGQVGVAGHLELGDRTVVGAQSGVSKSLSGGTIYMGYPAVPAQEWREEVALVHRLKKLFARVKRLEHSSGQQFSSLDGQSSVLKS